MSGTDSSLILFVVGVHRSGTSALCAALAACGASFGEQLLGAMAGVNDEGFWEDARVVALNEQLLALADSTWYAPAPVLDSVDWAAERFQPLREHAAIVLRDGFGAGPVQVVKDPRLCLTLPFWLDLCAELAIDARVCVTSRAPLEVARSLQKRDGFPLGYGLRLYLTYRDGIRRCVPPDALQLGYDELLQDTAAVMTRLARALPLAVPASGLAGAVRVDLRHQAVAEKSGLLAVADQGAVDLALLQQEIEAHYPADETLRQFAREFALRGQELERIGAEHTAALATLDQRDADVAALSAEHRQALATLDQRDADVAALSGEHRSALATIDERDGQIREFDRRLAQLGGEHSYALQIIRERDEQVAAQLEELEYIHKLPGIGFVIRRLRKNAQG